MMREHGRYLRRSVVFVLLALLLVGPPASRAGGKKLFKKEFAVTVTVPDSTSGNSFGVQSFIIKARKFDAPPSPLPLRKLTATSSSGAKVQGVWRQNGKDFSLTFELPCESTSPCGTLILRGQFT